jgi:hypothetical protein
MSKIKMLKILLAYYIISGPIYCVNQKPNTELKTSDNSFFETFKDFLNTSVEYISLNPIKACSGIVTLTAGFVIVYKISRISYNAFTNQEVPSQENNNFINIESPPTEDLSLLNYLKGLDVKFCEEFLQMPYSKACQNIKSILRNIDSQIEGYSWSVFPMEDDPGVVIFPSEYETAIINFLNMLKSICVENEKTKMIVEECYIILMTNNPKSSLLWEGIVNDHLCHLAVGDIAPGDLVSLCNM